VRAMRRTSQAPMKVYETTRTQVRFAAVLKDTSQAEIMETAMNEYIERHAEDFALGLKHAREALLAGPIATAAYLLDEDIEDLQKVAGSAEPRPRSGTSRGERSRTTEEVD
jgi:hypothetical protein